MVRFLQTLLGLVCCAFLQSPAWADSSLPPFQAIALNGDSVTADKLIGQPSILIVTPSRDAAPGTRQWAQTLRKDIDPGKVKVYDALTISLPFFMTPEDAIDIARKKIPSQYYDQTWLLTDGKLESGMNIPSASSDPFLFVLDAAGHVKARVQGTPSDQHVEEIRKALSNLPKEW